MIPSSGHYWSIQRDHVRSVGENTLKHHEHITLHRSDSITYNLWVKTRGETMSTLSWSIRRNYAHPVGDKTISTESAPSNGNTHHLLLWVDIWMKLLALLLQILVHYHILSVVVQSAIRGDGEDKTWGGVPTEHWWIMCPASSPPHVDKKIYVHQRKSQTRTEARDVVAK